MKHENETSTIDLMKFGLYLKSLREKNNLTLLDLSKATGYSDAYISQVEKARRKNPPTIELLRQLSTALDEPFSELLKRAGYDDLAEGQYYKEVFSTLGLGKDFPDDFIEDESNEALVRATKLMNVWYRGAVKWTADRRLNDIHTTILREHFGELLLRYKELIENLANINHRWDESKEDIMNLWGDSTTKVGARQMFLKVELEDQLQNITEWVDGFPGWIANNEDKILGGERNGHDPKKK